MGLIDENTQSQIKDKFKDLPNNVEIIYYEDTNSQFNEPIKLLLKEVSELSPKISFKLGEGDKDLKPYFEIKGVNKGVIGFAGVPSGYEFTTLIESIILASTGNHSLSEKTVKFLNSLQKEIDIKVFVTTTCPYCPRAVLLAFQFALVSEKVKSTMIEAMEFQELSTEFGISSVPATFVNNKEAYVGAYPENEAIERIKLILA